MFLSLPRHLIAGAALIGCASAGAHEYWLDPLDATITLGQPLLADLRNGQDYVGDAFPFDPARFNVASLTGPDGVQPLVGRLGDYPAIRLLPDKAGLYRIALETTDRKLDYDSTEKFAEFAAYHGLGDLLARHRARGLPADDVDELFARFAIAYVDVRDSAGKRAMTVADEDVLQPAGLLYELAPVDDPYASESLTLSALYRGEPRADVQVERFFRSEDGAVTRDIARTGADGQVTFDVVAPGAYLFNSVMVLESDAAVPWRSLWASTVIERD